MMNDIFIEQLIKKKRTIKDNIIFIAVILFFVLVPVIFCVLAKMQVVIAYFVYIAFFILVAGIWVIWYVRTSQNIEFEYQMVQDTLVVSKIIAKRKRKQILKIDVREFDILDKGNDEKISKAKFTKVFEACEDLRKDEETYYATFNHTGYGKCALIFNPNEKILNSMKPYLKKDIVLKLFYKRG